MRLEARAASTGELQWKAELPGQTDRQPEVTAVGGDVVYASSGSNVQAFATAGCGDERCEPLWSADVGGRIASLGVTQGRLYVATNAGLRVFGLPDRPRGRLR